jgi:hypothetical protein
MNDQSPCEITEAVSVGVTYTAKVVHVHLSTHSIRPRKRIQVKVLKPNLPRALTGRSHPRSWQWAE